MTHTQIYRKGEQGCLEKELNMSIQFVYVY